MKNLGQVCISIGGQWGDEGKGKLIDNLAEGYDIIVRSAGGANAGHSIHVNGKKLVTHLMPSGVLQGKTCVIGNGCVVHLATLLDEIHELDAAGVQSAPLLKISDRAHLIFDFHKEIDGLIEENKSGEKVGTTKRGVGPAYMFKALRNNLRIGDLFYDFDSFVEKLSEQIEFVKTHFGLEVNLQKELKIAEDLIDNFEGMVCDTTELLIQAKKDGKKILLEGAQGALLDVDQGTYPFVTSSNTTSAGACTGSGIAPNEIDAVVAIVKAYTTRVGNGPFPTELDEVESEALRQKGGEFGATTGRPRRCGWLDLVSLKRTCEISGVSHINITKLDVLSEIAELKVGTAYRLNGKEISSIPLTQAEIEKMEVDLKTFEGWEEDISAVRKFEDLPKNAQDYIKFIEEFVGVKIAFIGVGMDREDLIFC